MFRVTLWLKYLKKIEDETLPMVSWLKHQVLNMDHLMQIYMYYYVEHQSI